MANQKQFGVWMDTQVAIVVGKDMVESETFPVLSSIKRGK